MKWYNAVIGALFVIAMVVYAGTISGCGVDVTSLEALAGESF